MNFKFTVICSGGCRCLFTLAPAMIEYGKPYLFTDGAGGYLVDLDSGRCDGVEGTTGCTVQLVPHALKRLRKLVKQKKMLLKRLLL